jgi:4-hydroxymandelate oxidase
MRDEMNNRRSLLRWLAVSPVLALSARIAKAAGSAAASAADMLDVFEMEAAAQKVVPPAHWGYLQSGVDGDVTLRANQAGYAHWQLL